MGKGFLGMNINTLSTPAIKPSIVEFEETMTKLASSSEEVGYVIRNKGEERLLKLLEIFLETSDNISIFVNTEEDFYQRDDVYSFFNKYLRDKRKSCKIVLFGENRNRLTELFYNRVDPLDIRVCNKLESNVSTVIYKLNEGHNINFFTNDDNFSFSHYLYDDFRSQAYLRNYSYNDIINKLFELIFGSVDN